MLKLLSLLIFSFPMLAHASCDLSSVKGKFVQAYDDSAARRANAGSSASIEWNITSRNVTITHFLNDSFGPYYKTEVLNSLVTNSEKCSLSITATKEAFTSIRNFEDPTSFPEDSTTQIYSGKLPVVFTVTFISNGKIILTDAEGQSTFLTAVL